MDLFGTHRHIVNKLTPFPFGNCLWVETMAPGQRCYALLTALYCATNCPCRSGAAMWYLSHSCSFQMCRLSASLLQLSLRVMACRGLRRMGQRDSVRRSRRAKDCTLYMPVGFILGRIQSFAHERMPHPVKNLSRNA
jgi:hypothetical protein